MTFFLPDGGETVIDHTGHAETLMEVSRRHGIPGVIGDCGGFMSCATCHVHVAPEWLAKLGAAPESEREMIAMTADPRPESRLACQIWVVPELDGLTVRVAAH